jgi:CheY-like chemotaxis protein
MSRKRTILIADDNEDDALLMQCAFERLGTGYAIRVVPDGQELIDYLGGKGRYGIRADHPLPALVLVDLNLPRVDGLKVLSWVSEQPQFKTLPIVAMTGSFDHGLARRALALGASDHLIKPSGFGELVITIEQHLESWLDGGGLAVAA